MIVIFISGMQPQEEEEKSGEDQTPAYAPGSVVIIRKKETRIHRRCVYMCVCVCVCVCHV